MLTPVKPKILLIDDSGILLRNVKSLLDDKYDVDIAISGKTALKMILQETPDLIVLDYEMPEMNGRDTYEAIRHMPGCAKTPIIFLTSVDDRDTILSLMFLKPAGYVLKPVDIDKLRETIASALVRF